ncbi:MAG: DUF885 domain-containing protein [Candidatus Limnocylindrales bacterium]
MTAALPAFQSQVADARPAPRTAFDRAFKALLDDLFAALPVWATAIGFHAYDDRWPDLSEAGRLARLALYARHRAALAALSEGELSADERIDRGIVLDALDSLTFEDEVLRENAWDALGYVATVGSGLHELLAREYAPWSHRGTAFAWRAQRIGEVFRAAADSLVGLPGRPVSRLHVETALAQLPGLDDLVAEGIEEGERHEGGEAMAILAGLRTASLEASSAIEAFTRHLETVVLPHAQGEGRLGAELFAEKLRHTLGSDDGPSALRARAQADYEAVRGEMVRLARRMWPTSRPDEPLPDGDDAIVGGVLDVIARDHPAADELLDFCRSKVADIEAFVRERGVISLPDAPLTVTWTPPFLRPYGGAFLSPPGPLDKGLLSEFWVTPPDPSWPPERLESYLREQNGHMLDLLCIHEAVPGHYVQLAASNTSSSLARAVFSSGVFAEGWAVYIEQVMMNAGYRADDPALMLSHWKYELRGVVNTLLDIGIHVDGMSEEAALRLMVEGAFQEQQEATAKYLRARLSSTQLATYYVGSVELWDLEYEVRRRAAVAAGASAETAGEPDILRVPSAPPGFDLRAYLESVIAHGTPPVRWLRRILLEG